MDHSLSTISASGGSVIDPGVARLTVYSLTLGPRCTVAAVCDANPGRREQLTARYGCDRAYAGLEELLADDSVDAVAIFTGAPDHASHSIAAMEAGKHCICAVPAAMTLDDCKALIEAKERTGMRYMMAETSYYRWETILMRDLYESGEFGEITYSEVEYYHPIYQGHEERDHYWWDADGKPTWRHGFVPMLYPTHSTGFLVGVTRERLVSASGLGSGPSDDPNMGAGRNQYDNPFSSQAALMETSGGHICRCNVMFGIHAHGERAQWFGERSAAYMAGSGGQPFVVQLEGRDPITELPDYWDRLPDAMRDEGGHGNSHPFLTHEFISAIVDDREPAIDVYESVAMTAPGIVAHQSSLQGGIQLPVPNFDPSTGACTEV
ncbi:MAG TPA: Gfo/Idh/MocA family oxidoreductase [Armatimonadota bacterium]|nr:Gfo/Idh/MocA family oxidoreductase [Armatimonadota bacterium]